MWKLPDGTIIKVPKRTLIGDTQYPSTIYHKWSKKELQAVGIYQFVDTSYDFKFYNAVEHQDDLADGVIVRTYTLEQRYTNSDLRKRTEALLKKNLFSLLRRARQEQDYLSEFESDNDISKNQWLMYISNLKSAAQDIKTAVQGISSYDAGVAFITETFYTMFPEQPKN